MTTATADFVPKASHLFIDGRWAEAGDGGSEAVINPATEEVIRSAASGTLRDAELALAAARRAFDDGPWPGLDRAERVRAVARINAAMAARRDQILALVQLECGYTRTESLNQYLQSERHTLKFMEIAARDPMRSLPVAVSGGAGQKVLTAGVVTRAPIGVVTVITPYNAGFFLAVVKAIPALLAGNTVILKPSPFTPLQAFLLAEIMAEADLPPGVFNLVTGGVDQAELLTSDERVDMVTFTGSDVVGARIMAQAAPTLKKVHLELGGKSALIVRHDGDLDIAVGKGMHFAFMCGQGCILPTRHLVHNKVREEYVARLAAKASAIRIGNPADETVNMGPLIRDVARSRSEKYVELGLSEGARLVSGGERPSDLDKGYYFKPTIFNDVSNDSRLAQEEIFGPIVAVIGFDTDEEAVKLANQSRYGLGSRIISRDAGTALEMAGKIRAGQVMLNNAATLVDMPFGGFKRSGLGREWGEEGYNEFTELKGIGFVGA